MATLAENLYLLAMRKSGLTFRSAATTQLGRITMAGFLRNNPGISPGRPRVLGRYAVVYVVDGAGRYADANGYSQAIQAGDLIVLFPELAHSYGGPWSEFYLVFEGPVFDLWRRHGLLDPRRPVLHVEPVHYWLSRLESVLGAPRRVGFAPPLLEVCRLQTVLGEALVGGVRDRGDLDWVAKACALLESDLQREVDLHELAAKLGTSFDSFRKRFTQIVGRPPAQYRRYRLIDRACELMQQGALTDKAIAAQLGFCDEFHFSRCFKAVTGRSPREFRRQLPVR